MVIWIVKIMQWKASIFDQTQSIYDSYNIGKFACGLFLFLTFKVISEIDSTSKINIFLIFLSEVSFTH